MLILLQCVLRRGTDDGQDGGVQLRIELHPPLPPQPHDTLVHGLVAVEVPDAVGDGEHLGHGVADEDEDEEVLVHHDRDDVHDELEGAGVAVRELGAVEVGGDVGVVARGEDLVDEDGGHRQDAEGHGPEFGQSPGVLGRKMICY